VIEQIFRRPASRLPRAASLIGDRFVARWVLILALAVVGLVMGRTTAQAAAVHYQTADISISAPAHYATPSVLLDPAAVPKSWSTGPLPHVVSRTKTGDKTLISTWYRLRYTAGRSADATFLYAPRWQVTGKLAIYADGKLVYAPRSGPQWMCFNLPIWVKLADPGAPIPSEILINIVSLKTSGGGISTVWIGDEGTIGLRHALRQWFQIDLTTLISFADAIFGVAAVVIWLRWRRDSAFLFLAAAAVFNIIWEIQFRTGEAPLLLSEPWFGWMTICALEWWILSSYLFALRIVGFRSLWLIGVIFGVAISFTVVTLPISAPGLSLVSASLSPLLDILTLGGVVVLLITLWVVYFRKPSHEGLVVCLYNTVWPIAGAHDVMLQDYKISIESFCLAPAMFALILLAMMYIMLRRYALAMREADSYASRLETRVREREAELEASHARLREIARRETVAIERQRLMREMHDGMGSSLIVALAAVERGNLSDADVAQMLRECVDDLKLTIDSLETVDTDLPLVLATLRYRLGPRFEQAGITLNWRVAETPPLAWLDPEHALHVLRIVQEIFTNIVKHAGASIVTVSTSVAGQAVLLTIEDNGVGFDAEAPVKSGRRGLANLRQRAEAIGATIVWASMPGATRFELMLPFEPQQPLR
jgi:signal transduction histidine kinase